MTALYQEHVSNLQPDSTQFELEVATANATILSLETNVTSLETENLDLSENLSYHSSPLYVDLNTGWNMFGFHYRKEWT